MLRVLLLASVVALAAAVPCALADVGGVSATCIASNPSAPYCVSTGNGTTASCNECRSTCDCPLDRYCSRRPATNGFCVSYVKQGGSSCVAMSDAELLNPALPIEWKCVSIFTDPQTGALVMDWKGSCYGYSCYPCQAGPVPSSVGLPPTIDPCPVPFNDVRRVCALPGWWINADNSPWSPVVFLNNPAAVWLAIIWSFMFCFAIFFVVMACSNRRQRALSAARGAGR